MKPEIKKAMDDYRAAYLAANGHSVEIEYERGWFRIKCIGAWLGTKHRLKEIGAFTARLGRKIAR